jgi:kumamolisin
MYPGCVFARLLVALSILFLVLISQAAAPTLSRVRSLHDSAADRQLGLAYKPKQIQTAYDFTPLYQQGIDGTGQTIALIEIDSFQQSDLDQFDQRFGLPPVSVTVHYVGGHQFQLERNGETTMDIEWLHALAPGAAIQVYYLFNREPERLTWQAIGTALHQASNRGAGAISISLNSCRPGPGSDVTRTALSDMLQLGVSVFVSSGDTGPHPGTVHECGHRIGVGYPNGDPSVVSVGGTSLDLNDDGSIANETAWPKSGGGALRKLSRPAWQVAPQLPHDNYRWVPDVAFLADPQTGVAIYYNGEWSQAGGTSLGAPAWAAIWALVRQDAQEQNVVLGSAPALLYRLGNSHQRSRVFHDITQGGNSRFRAGPGWDAVTGWGTPDVANLADALNLLPSQR